MQVFELPPIIRQIQDELNAMRGRLDSLESVGEKGEGHAQDAQDKPGQNKERDVQNHE